MVTFNGTERFRLVQELGAGGMGVVYEAEDRLRHTRVALKTLKALNQTDANLLYRLKQEFRGLRDLVHRNLVSLDELFEENGSWFFTMELIDGVTLLSYLRGSAAPVVSGLDVTSVLHRPLDGEVATESQRLGSRIAPRLDFEQIRSVFGQITEGVLAIHEAGKIHRDIKPSNVMVTKNGRVVILDFGLATELQADTRSHEGEIVGTVAYMAPEQANGGAVTTPADWYSVGVMLYEVITGQPPFAGPVGVLLTAKQISAPPDPRRRNPDCPADLAMLCNQLLQADPGKRPQGSDVLVQLRIARRDSGASIHSDARARPSSFVGRAAELAQLERALCDVATTGAITAFVHGESGIGKSMLIRRFVTAKSVEVPRTVVLIGECREHEAVPFKAVDRIIDALSRFLCRLSDVAAAELIPPNAALLTSVFPVLGRVPAIAAAPRPAQVAADPFQQRKRVFTALRELLRLLTERYRLICVIDDMQWVDSDSLTLLEDLMRPPDEPRLLLLASLRASDEAPALPPIPGEVRSLRLQRLNPDESTALAGILLERVAPEHRTRVERIVDESAGHPLFIAELVRYAAADTGATPRQLHLEEAIWARASQLEHAALDVLKILVVAVVPLPEDVIYAAAGLEASQFQRAVATLRVGTLIRSAAAANASLEVYHDRVRQSVSAHLDEAERTALNDRLATALGAPRAPVQPEILIHHLEGAGKFAHAARQALEAAERALGGLAFEQAAQLYEAALRLGQWTEDERRPILIQLGSALASAGRGADAADAYGKAAIDADPATQLNCRIQVADQLVASGRLENGAALLFSLFREHGHEVPGSQLEVTLGIAWYRIRLAMRGLRWTDRAKHDISPQELALLALYRAAGRGLILVDPVRAAYFVIRGLNLALDIGDRDSVMNFVLLEAGFRGGEGGKKHAAFLGRADALMRDYPEPQFQVSYRLSLGTRTYVAMDREFKQAFDMLDRSERELSQTANAAWELSAGRFFLIHSLRKMGDFVQMKKYAQRFIREAQQRGNVYGSTTLRRLCNLLWLVDDDPVGAREELTKDSWLPFTQGYHSQHWLELNALIEIAIYEGTSVDKAFVLEHLSGLKKSFLRRVLGYRCDTAWLIGRMALSEMASDPQQKRSVRRSIAKLMAYNTQYARVLASMLRATLAVHEGNTGAAIAEFRDAMGLAEQTQVFFIAAVARRRLGLVIGGAEGRELVTAAEQWMRHAGIKNVERMTTLLSPCELRTGAQLVGRPTRLLPSTA